MAQTDGTVPTRTETLLHAVAASSCAAMVATVLVFKPFGTGVIGQFVAVLSAAVTGVIALLLSPVMLWLARRVGHLAYVCSHALAGIAIGLFSDLLYPLGKYYSYPITVPVVASLGAWLYIVLFYPAKNGWIRANRAQGFRGIALVLGLLALVIFPHFPPVPVPPHATGSTSCFNVFRDGRTSVPPAMTVHIHVTDSSASEIHAFYQQFAASHEMKITGHPVYGAESASANFCNEQVLVWAGGLFPARVPTHSLSVFDLDDDDDWRPLTEQLICALENRWPGTLSNPRAPPAQQAFLASTLESDCSRLADAPPD